MNHPTAFRYIPAEERERERMIESLMSYFGAIILNVVARGVQTFQYIVTSKRKRARERQNDIDENWSERPNDGCVSCRCEKLWH